jgi:hypothetical protein
MHARGIEVDDYNEPAPENVPRQEARQADCQYGEWGFDGIDNRHVGNHSNTGASFGGMSKEKVSVLSPLNLFFILFPTDFIKNIILPKTNESLSKECKFGEFIVFIGLWFMMGLMQGFEHRDYSSREPISMFYNDAKPI